MPCDAAPVLRNLTAIARAGGDRDVLGRALVKDLKQSFPQSSWAGIYWLEGQELVLGPYEGPATDHVRIPVGVGVCGTAVARGEDQVVPDVRARANYLACSATVRSEIVVLVRADGRIVGQLDLDSEKVDAFSADDHCVLKAIASSFGGLLSQRS